MLLKKESKILNLNKYAKTVNLKIIFKEKINGLINCDPVHCQGLIEIIRDS